MIVIGLAVLGILAAVVAFLRTPSAYRYRIAPLSLDEQLKACPESAQAVIIKGDKKRALVAAAPYIAIGIVLAGFSLWIKYTDVPTCARLFGLNAIYISLLLMFYVLPVVVLVMSLSFLGTGIRTLRTGYSPPLDTVVFQNTIAKKGTVSTVRGVILLVLPIFFGFMAYLGNDAFTKMTGGKNTREIVEKIEAECQQRVPR